jgi:amino acid transporter
VSRYFFALGRARVFPAVFARTRASGAPHIGSLAQTIIAVTVVAVFALSDNDPVLQLFTWLTNLGAMGVILLLALASFAVVGYFRKIQHSETMWTSQIAPALAGLGLTMVFFLVIDNFNLLITGIPDAPTDDRSIILPAILIGGGIIGMIVGLIIKSTRPDVYERIGEMGEEEIEGAPPG